jgi:hypothetical protein
MRKAQPERILHKQVADYLDLALPPSAFWWPTPNASKRLPHQAANMKRAKEMRPGIPDIMICSRGRLICIELKAPKGRVSIEQEVVHAFLTLSGAVVCVCRSLDDVIDLLIQIVPDLKIRSAA